MTTIEWTQRPGTKGESWNPIRAQNLQEARSAGGATGKDIRGGGLGHFCEHVSEGCRNCYAERRQPRFRNPIRYARQDRDKVEILLDEAKLEAPLHWRDPRTVFVCSMTDLFGEWVEEAWLDRIFAVMALTPRHTYQVLTKRPERMRDYLADPNTGMRQLRAAAALGLAPPGWREDRQDSGHAAAHLPLPNVWLGVSAEDQATADARIPLLLETPAALRFVSYEPALGPVDFTNLTVGDYEVDSLQPLSAAEIWRMQWDPKITGENLEDSIEGFEDYVAPYPPSEKRPPGLDWMIAGGESGSKRTPDPDWFRDVAMQCALAKVPFFFKQWGGARHGSGGRLLDGREYNEWPR